MVTAPNVITDRFAERLKRVVDDALDRMKPHRRRRAELLSQLAGPHASTSGATGAPEPLNTLHMVAGIIVPNLFFHNPRVLVTADDPYLREEADLHAADLARQLERLDFQRAMRTVLVDALVGLGAMKVGRSPGRVVELDGQPVDVGELFVEPVDLDDYFLDPSARDRRQATFEGNRWTIDFDALRGEGFDAAVVDRMSPRRESSNDAPRTLRPRAELLDVWLPAEGVMLTLPASPGVPGVLREVPWQGHPHGPYETLAMFPLPGRAMPVPLLSVILDLHLLINKLARKAGRQADRAKSLLVAPRAAEEDAETIRAADDGDVVLVDFPEQIRNMTAGEVDASAVEHVGFLAQWLSRIAGNTNLLGGIVADSNTATQDRLLMDNATVAINDMRMQTHRFAQRVVERIAWYRRRDPLLRERLLMRAPGGAEYPAWLDGRDLDGDWSDFSIELDLYSALPDDPAQRRRRMGEWITGAVIPLAEQARRSGVEIDYARLLAEAARAADIPGAEDYVRS
jgi:hypothetical protein